MKTARPARGFAPTEIFWVLLVITVLALVAIPVSRQVRASQQDKAVLGNLRRLVAASEQYFRENGTSTVALSSLVGPTAYLRTLHPVANETYPAVLHQGQPVVVTNVGGTHSLSLSTWAK